MKPEPQGIEAASLVAVAGKGRRRIATVQLPGGKSRPLKLGDRIDEFGARVVAVNTRSVLLETSTGERDRQHDHPYRPPGPAEAVRRLPLRARRTRRARFHVWRVQGGPGTVDAWTGGIG